MVMFVMYIFLETLQWAAVSIAWSLIVLGLNYLTDGNSGMRINGEIVSFLEAWKYLALVMFIFNFAFVFAMNILIELIRGINKTFKK